MKKYLKGKNVLAAILCATLMLGIVPFTVFAANTDENLYTKNQISTSVQYLNQERTQAEITYSVPIEPQDPVNVIFLVDASKTGENSKNEVVELIMGHGDGVDLMSISFPMQVMFKKPVSSTQRKNYKSIPALKQCQEKQTKRLHLKRLLQQCSRHMK